MAAFRRRWQRSAAGAAAALALSACAGRVSNDAINEPIASVADQGGWPLGPDQFGSTVVGVAFSGGGMRASAFSYGVLTELDRYQVQTDRGPRRMTEMVDLISGVSGGSVTAAYFGLKGREGCPASASHSSTAMPNRVSTPTSTSPASADLHRWRRQRPLEIPALARRQCLRRRDLREPVRAQAAAGLDRRVRHLFARSVRIRASHLQCPVQRP